jgi:hypothetical protein
MRNQRDAIDYMLFFGTNNELGLKKMKEAMWRIDESGTYSFSDATDPNQTVLFAKEPDRKLLEKLIREKFFGKEVSVQEIENFVIRDTSFRETHYKKILQALEKNGLINVTGPNEKRRSGTFADPELKIAFVEK